MDIFDVITLGGGLAFFLYGMNQLGAGLEKVSGGRMEKMLEKLTSNVVKSVLLGLIVTAAIQSSSATTVIVVGLVNAGILKLRNAVGVIMGANIGTTVTAQILRLGGNEDSPNLVMQFLNPKALAPMIAIAGIIMIMVAKRNKFKDIGSILVGFGILFQGMFIMEGAVSGLKDVPEFQQLFVSLQNPILGVLVGAVVTGMELQQDSFGRVVTIQPRFFIAPIALKTTCESFFNTQITGGPVVGTQAQPLVHNPYGGEFFRRIYDRRLDLDAATTWYLAAARSTVKVFFLGGVQAPYIESRDNFDTDGFETKVRMDVGAKALRWITLAKATA